MADGEAYEHGTCDRIQCCVGAQRTSRSGASAAGDGKVQP